jgi:hypothetical protein
MAFTCNIDRRGKRARLINGIIFVAIGITLMLSVARGSGSILMWGIAIVPVICGAFAIFEGAIGWCALRALGMKTHI